MGFLFCFLYFIGQKTSRGSFLIQIFSFIHSLFFLFFSYCNKKNVLVPLQLLPGESQKSHAGPHGSGWWSGAQGRGKSEHIYLQADHSGEEWKRKQLVWLGLSGEAVGWMRRAREGMVGIRNLQMKAEECICWVYAHNHGSTKRMELWESSFSSLGSFVGLGACLNCLQDKFYLCNPFLNLVSRPSIPVLSRVYWSYYLAGWHRTKKLFIEFCPWVIC